MKKIKLLLLTLCTNVALYGAYEYEDPTLGNIAIEGSVWSANLDGSIKNNLTTVDFKDDLQNDTITLTSFALELKNDYWFLPNMRIDYAGFHETATGSFDAQKAIGNKALNFRTGQILSDIEYSQVDAKFYGYLQQSIMMFDLGINLKKINYTQTIEESDYADNEKVLIEGPKDIIVLPYIGVKLDLYPIHTIVHAETSIVSIGKDEAKDYKLSINYRIMRNMYVGVGYKYSSFVSKNASNSHEEYEFITEGNYISAKILF